jgi:hypothetical protein
MVDLAANLAAARFFSTPARWAVSDLLKKGTGSEPAREKYRERRWL